MSLEAVGTATSFEVAGAACIRCAACATLAPGVFRVGPRSAAVARQPSTETELRFARAAALTCPTGAIVARAGTSDAAPAADPPAPAASPSDFLHDAIFSRASLEAEAVRWRVADLPLDEIDHSRVTGPLRRLVRAIALSEVTTFSATRRFLDAFADDADLSQWMAVWLYEETRHPQAMMRWLGRLGERVDEREIGQARATAPLIRSRMTTLVMNVISEAIAAARYLSLSRTAPEPVLGRIAALLASDEARHGATFHAYAARRLARAAAPDEERLDAVKALWFWLFESGEVLHPVNLFGERARGDAELLAAIETMRPRDEGRLERRLCLLVGNLTGLDLDGREAVRPALRDLAAAVRARRAAEREPPDAFDAPDSPGNPGWRS